MKDVIERAPCTTAVAVEAAEVPARLDVVPRLLERIRPEWQAKELISRVRRLLPVDLSSACQRVLNAAIHDLRQKLIFAGVDLAREAARQHKLPPVERTEDIEDYRIARLIDLAYRVGLLSRAEWRRLCRAYEIRRDLEHEDDEYQADIADCIYIFKASVEIVLSKDPLTLIRVTDVKEIVEAPSPVAPDEGLIEDFKQAPEPRQTEIWKSLVSIALDSSKPDLLRQNAFALIQWFEPYTKDAVKLAVAEVLQERIGRNCLDL